MSIEVKNLKKSFKDKVILDDVSFKVEDGEILAVVGLSGAGKKYDFKTHLRTDKTRQRRNYCFPRRHCNGFSILCFV